MVQVNNGGGNVKGLWGFIKDKFTSSEGNSKTQNVPNSILTSCKNGGTKEIKLTPSGNASIFTEKNEQGQIVNQVVYKGNGLVSKRDTYEYNEAGQVTKHVRDERGDGPDYIETIEYDDNGRLTKQVIDSNGDGQPDFIETRKYDAAGNTVEIATDSNGDGRAEITTKKYDAAGNVVEIADDLNGDGVPEHVYNYQGFGV